MLMLQEQDTSSSSELDSSGDVDEDLEKVENLVVMPLSEVKLVVETKTSETTTETKDEIEESETIRDDDSSMRTEEEQRIKEELLQKEQEDTLSHEEEEVKKEEEKRNKMKMLLRGYLEHKTQKEIERAILNEKKIISQWLYPFRGAYQKEWELEMKKLKLGFQKALDYKKSHIDAIQQERKLVELNQLSADSAHYQTVEDLFQFMRERCEKLKQKYLEEMENTKKYYLGREADMVEKCKLAEERAKALVSRRKDIKDRTLQNTKETLENFKHESEYMRTKELEQIEQKHRMYVEAINTEFQTAISPPEHRMDEIRTMFTEWKEKYENFLQIRDKNWKELTDLRGEIPRLEGKVQTATKQLQDLQKESKTAKELRSKEIVRLQKITRKYESVTPKLRELICESDRVMTLLKEKKDKLDKIMNLKKLCDKLELESDSILPESSSQSNSHSERPTSELARSTSENAPQPKGSARSNAESSIQTPKSGRSMSQSAEIISEAAQSTSKAVSPGSGSAQSSSDSEDDLSWVRGMCSTDIEDQKLLKNLYHKMSRVRLQNNLLKQDIHNLQLEQTALKNDMKNFLHLIGSGEWKRVSDQEFQEAAAEKARISEKMTTSFGENEEMAKNLAFLEKRFRTTNEKIVQQAERPSSKISQ